MSHRATSRLRRAENAIASSSKLSRERILAIFEAGPEAVVALVEKLLATQANLTQQVGVLTAHVRALEAQLNKDSHNSHKPPSSDGPAKRPRPRSMRKQIGRASC